MTIFLNLGGELLAGAGEARPDIGFRKLMQLGDLPIRKPFQRQQDQRAIQRRQLADGGI